MPPISPEILKQVKTLELRTRGLVSSLFAGEYRSVFRGQGMEFAEVRSYEQGDDYRAIDWNVSARLGTPYVKTFSEERELTVMLIVDLSGSTHFGSPRTKASMGVEVAAVIALSAAYHNDRVGALLFTDRVDRVIPPAKGRRHAMRVIRDLVAFAPGTRRTDLGGSLRYASQLLHHRSIVAIISDFIAKDWEQPLRRLSARHDVVAITLEDPRERQLPETGWVELEDAETGRRILLDAGDRVSRGRLATLAERRREGRIRSLAAAGVDEVVLSTATDYALPLRRAFAQRARRIHR